MRQIPPHPPAGGRRRCSIRLGLSLLVIAGLVLYAVFEPNRRNFQVLNQYLLLRIRDYFWQVPLNIETLARVAGGVLLAFGILKTTALRDFLSRRGKPARLALGAGFLWLVFALVYATTTRFDFPPTMEITCLLAGPALLLAWCCLRLPDLKLRQRLPERAEWVIFAAAGVLATLLSTKLLYEDVIVVSDANSQVAQARLLAAGEFKLNISQALRNVIVFPNALMTVPAYSQYPPGYILPLTALVRFNLPLRLFDLLGMALMTPIMCWLAGRLAGPAHARPARWAALLMMLGSPIIYAMSGSMMNHGWTAELLIAVLFCFWTAGERLTSNRSAGGWLLAGGLALGWAMITRPLTGLSHALVWGAAAAGYLGFRWRADGPAGLRRALWQLLPAGVGLAIAMAVLFYYNAETTGNPLKLGYTAGNEKLHRLGFGVVGFDGTVYTPLVGLDNLLANVVSLNFMLLGWCFGSWPALLAGWLRARRNLLTVLVAALCVAQAGLYYFYNFHDLLVGPRFWYEFLPLLIAFAAAGVAPALAWIREGEHAYLPRLAWLLLILMTAGSLLAAHQFWSSRYSTQLVTHRAFYDYMEANDFSQPTVVVLDLANAEMAGRYFRGTTGVPLWFVYREKLEAARRLPELAGCRWVSFDGQPQMASMPNGGINAPPHRALDH